ncbi:MAG: MiaB/RimO family radical SAM methylthiotransferase [Anaerolineaceae bacterium]|nr:MiaB/RimO family radical SAM methylthiotransferase [Anaerolineaceae bacterium]
MKVFLDMVGCRLNQAEIEQLALDLTARGQEIVAEPTEADYVVINTCCVTAKAAADSRKMVRHYQRSTGAKVLAMGCWVSAFPQDSAELVGSDAVFTSEKRDLVLKRLNNGEIESAVLREELVKPDLGSRSRTRSFIKVQEGCNNACSYCLTRIARGKSRSIPAEEVVRQIAQSEDLGVQEVVLTGVQIGAWGKDLEGNLRISDLIEAILLHTKVPRIRISSIEPWDVDEHLLACFEDVRLCPYLHLPLQSGNDAILRRMARPITTTRYRELIETIGKHLPELAITTDIIVGFPGETDALFEETFQFIAEMPFSGGHVFKFSPMPGTLAAKFEEQIPAAISHERAKRIRELLQARTRAIQTGKIGSETKVLWEQGKENGSQTYYTGLTPDFFRVRTQSKVNLTNTITLAHITGLDQAGLLIGELI